MKEENKQYGIIYLIRNKINNKCYIGQTINKRGFKGRYYFKGKGIERVYNYHKNYKLYGRDYYNAHLLNSIEKYGFDAFEVDEEFDIAYSKEELDKLEDMYIKIYDCIDNGYNQKEGGANGKFSEEAKQKMREKAIGRKHTEESIKRMSESQSGENNGFYGKHHTEEAKQKMSESKKEMYKGEGHPFYGKNLEEEHKQKISETLKNKYHEGYLNPNKGKHLSEEQKAKLRKANSGKNSGWYGKHHTEEQKRKIGESNKGKRQKPVYCYELNEIRLNATLWSEELNICYTNILKCCRGKQKTCGGYHFRWATQEEIEEYKKRNNIDK